MYTHIYIYMQPYLTPEPWRGQTNTDTHTCEEQAHKMPWIFAFVVKHYVKRLTATHMSATRLGTADCKRNDLT